MQRCFKDFEMDRVWVETLVVTDVDQDSFEQAKKEIQDSVLQKVYNRDLKQKILTTTSKEHNLIEELSTFAKQIPDEYKVGSLPPQFLDFVPKDFMAKVASSGDALLCKQVTFIVVFHGAVRHAAELAALRSCDIGSPSGTTTLDQHFVGLVSKLRKLCTGALGGAVGA